MNPKRKWRFAIGTTSRVPTREEYHYLIADFDTENIPLTPFLSGILSNGRYFWEPTQHGWHLYTNIIFPFPKLVTTLQMIEADPAWIEIGEKRGYFFLAHKSYLRFNWPVEYMILNHGKEKTQNTGAPWLHFPEKGHFKIHVCGFLGGVLGRKTSPTFGAKVRWPFYLRQPTWVAFQEKE